MRWGGIASLVFVACSSFEAGDGGGAPPGADAGPDATTTTGASNDAGPSGSSCPPSWFCDDFESGNLDRWDYQYTGRAEDTIGVASADRPGAPAGNRALHVTTAGIIGSSARIDAFAQKVQPAVPGGTVATRAWVRFGTMPTPLVYPFLMTARHTGDANRQYFLDGVVVDDAVRWGLQTDHTGRDYDGASDVGAAKPTEWTCLELDVRLAPDDAMGRVRLFVHDRLVAEKARSTVDAATVSEISTYELWAGITRPGPTVAGDVYLDDIAFAHFDDDPSGDAPRIGCGP